MRAKRPRKLSRSLCILRPRLTELRREGCAICLDPGEQFKITGLATIGRIEQQRYRAI